MKRARSNRPSHCPYVTKGGLKLAFALDHFGVSVRGLVTADLGCHKGGFTDCLLQHGALRVHAVDTGYGILDWPLRNDARVVVHERKNLIHWHAPEPLDLVAIDAGWTPQRFSVPVALRSLRPGGAVLSLVKPQYEARKTELKRGVLPPSLLKAVVQRVKQDLSSIVSIEAEAHCPIPGSGGNTEVWFLLKARA